ncbi:MAG: L,D-transpeptidase family protein [Planctomycetes bacterium]|nr:L,D-transpeptidase family protein [Planctomycetota bacterium]
MRQILVLGLLAVLGWWLYGGFSAQPADAAGSGTTVGGVDANGPANGDAATTSASRLADLLGGGKAATDEAATPAVPPAGIALDSDGQRALLELIASIEGGDAAAIDLGWQAMASGALAAPLQQRLATALQGPGQQGSGDFATMLKRLGSHNSFLHSPQGRAQAEAVFAAAMALPDGEAIAAGTKVLESCLRGRIEKQDGEARAFVNTAYGKYRARAARWLCNSGNVAGARSYTVASGDSLNRIARKFRREGLEVEEGTIAALNGIHNKNAIQVGQKLKIPVDPIHAVIEKRSYSLSLYVGDQLLRLYWVGHGRDDKTPVTEFKVGAKKPQPPWTAPDGNVYPYGHPKNILGEYWIQLSHDYAAGFGIHGTPMPDTIGTMSSDGCIRMLAADIADLFEILPRGAAVEVRATEARS